MVEQKYARIIDEETHEVQLGVGCTDEYYAEIGMQLMDVEQAYNGGWYVAGWAPEEPEPPVPTHDDISNMRKWAYTERVDGLHAQKMRHQILGDWTEEDETKYRQKVIQLSREIEEHYPYPEE